MFLENTDGYIKASGKLNQRVFIRGSNGKINFLLLEVLKKDGLNIVQDYNDFYLWNELKKCFEKVDSVEVGEGFIFYDKEKIVTVY